MNQLQRNWRRREAGPSIAEYLALRGLG